MELAIIITLRVVYFATGMLFMYIGLDIWRSSYDFIEKIGSIMIWMLAILIIIIAIIGDGKS